MFKKSRAVQLYLAATLGPPVVVAVTALVFGFAFGVTRWLIGLLVVELVVGFALELAAIYLAGGLAALQSRPGHVRAMVIRNGLTLIFIAFALVVSRFFPFPSLLVLLLALAAVQGLFQQVVLLLRWRWERAHPETHDVRTWPKAP